MGRKHSRHQGLVLNLVQFRNLIISNPSTFFVVLVLFDTLVVLVVLVVLVILVVLEVLVVLVVFEVLVVLAVLIVRVVIVVIIAPPQPVRGSRGRPFEPLAELYFLRVVETGVASTPLAVIFSHESCSLQLCR